MPLTSPRDVSLDVVRLFGIIAIVAGHSFVNDGARAAIYTWHVPVFFFLSGYLWKSGRTLDDEVRRRTATLVVPYLFWLVAISVIFIPYIAITDGLKEAVRRGGGVVLGGYFLKSPYQAFWFVTALLVACVLYRLIDMHWSRSAFWLLLPVLAVSLVGEPLRLVPESVGLALPSVAFIALGHIARGVPTARSGPWLGGVLLASVAVLTWLGVNDPLDIKRADFGVPILGIACAAAVSWGLVLVAPILFGWVSGTAAVAVASLSELGLAVVLTHGVVVNLLLGKTDAWVVFSASLLFGLAAAWASSKTPLRSWALGGRAAPERLRLHR